MIRLGPKPPRIHPDDIAVWRDGDWCHLHEIEREMRSKSDDYERVRLENTARLAELGILEQIQRSHRPRGADPRGRLMPPGDAWAD